MPKWRIVAVFAAFGLIGPFFRLVVFRPAETFATIYVVQSITLLVWPAQVFGHMETSLGTALSLALAISANVLLFTILGVIASLAAGRAVLLWVVQVTVFGLVTAWAHLWRGFDAWWALLAALLIYSVPFELVRRKATRVVGTRG